MQARTLGVVVLAGLVVASGLAATAGAQGTVTPEPPTTPRLLQPLDALAGESIAQAIGSPDTPYAPEFPAQPLGPDGTAGTFERNTAVTSGQLTSEVVVAVGDVRGTARVKASICPDSGGSVGGSITISIASGVGIDATEHTSTARFSGKVDDGANLKLPPSVSTPGASGAEKQALDRFARQVLRNAEQAWRGGYCVKIEVLEGASRTVKPKETVAVSAKAIQRFDGSTIDRPMTAKLAGAKKVKPGSSSESPAAFTYTGPDKSPGKGDVTLRSVSRRGIGTEKIHYVAGGDLKIEASIGPARFSALKCGGPVGAWSMKVVADFGGVRSEETIGFSLSEDLSGPVSAGGVAFGPPGAVDTGNAGLASYDPVAKVLTISPGGSVPVTEGDFCE